MPGRSDKDRDSCFLEMTFVIFGSDASEWEIANNIIYNANSTSEVFAKLTDAIITHNFVLSYGGAWGEHFIIWNVTNSTITNNILINYYNSTCVFWNVDDATNNIVSHNIMTYNYNNYPNNMGLPGLATISPEIITNEGNVYRDTYYVFTPESLAKGYAEDGSDCGPFDGPYPYVLSGYPLYVPRFESIDVPSQPSADGKLHINLVIKNQNK